MSTPKPERTEMSRIPFDEVSVKGVFRWRDAAGKSHQKTEMFWQTMNPWNKNAEGYPKTRDEIMSEILKQRKTWLEQMKLEHD